LDARGLCQFLLLMEAPEVIVPMINAFYGVSWTNEDYIEMGKEMLHQERVFNMKAGIGHDADRIPDWMSKEALPPTNAIFDVPQEEIDSFFDF